MALQDSGSISINEVHIELGGTSGSQASLNDSDFRALANISSGAIALDDFYGLANEASVVGFAKVVDTTSNATNYTGSAQNLSIQNGDLLVLTYTCRNGNSGNNVGTFEMYSSTNGGGTQTDISGSTAVKEHGGTVSGIIYATSNGSYSSMKAKISASSNFNAMLMMAGVFRNAGGNSPDSTFTGGSGGTSQSVTLSSLSPPGVIIAVGGRSTTNSNTVTFSGLDSYINDNNSEAGGAAGYKLNTATSFSGTNNYAYSISAAHFT